MPNVNPPYADPGRASFEVLDTYSQSFLIAGSHPELAPAMAYPLPNNVTYEQFTPVGLNGSGQLVPALWHADPTSEIKPIGILAHAAALGASGTGYGQVWYSGCFNMAAIKWPVSYDTDAKKLSAFAGSPTPTNSLVAQRGA